MLPVMSPETPGDKPRRNTPFVELSWCQAQWECQKSKERQMPPMLVGLSRRDATTISSLRQRRRDRTASGARAVRPVRAVVGNRSPRNLSDLRAMQALLHPPLSAAAAILCRGEGALAAWARAAAASPADCVRLTLRALALQIRLTLGSFADRTSVPRR